MGSCRRSALRAGAAFVQVQAENTAGLGRDCRIAGIKVPLPVPDMRDALRLFQPVLAFLQAAKHQEAGERIGQKRADLLEQALLRLRPRRGTSARCSSLITEDLPMPE